MPTMPVLITTMARERDAYDGKSSLCVHLNHIGRELRGRVFLKENQSVATRTMRDG